MENQIVKEQFNKQAKKFADWAVTRNTAQMKGYYDFCEISPRDTLLDVACGPGAMTVFMAHHVRSATGVDISDNEIEIANNVARQLGIANIQFDCSDVEQLPYPDNSFSVVLCKAAFHHFVQPVKVFNEMKRCCMQGGKVSIQDIAAYDDIYVDEYFETFEKLVDICHHRTLQEREFAQLFTNADIDITDQFMLTVDLSVDEYLEHAVQDKDGRLALEKLIKDGIKDPRLKEYLFYRDDQLFFKRNVYLIVGQKKDK
ncbi:MAG: class I SAM-dependent methyltransferase [Niastella sp.]|jgi:ubiquinone/menaquinone biosynthesis C-methylase UbiE|uniref:class I SAM-dependent methyltransferase n=1 Tax=Niastella sp. TaxID=1869183 RepID=UPI00389B3514